MKTQTVKVLRAFLIEGKPQKVGEVIEVPAGFASELRSGNKVAFVAPEAKPSESKPVSSAATPQKGAK